MAQNHGHDRLHRAELIGAGLALGWLGIAGAVILLSPTPGAPFDGLRFIMLLVALLAPVAVIGVAVWTARSLRLMRDETYRLQLSIDKLHRAARAEGPERATARQTPQAAAPEHRPAPKNSQAVPPMATAKTRIEQPALALETTQQEVPLPLDRDDLIRALHFPDDENDREGFAALRRALKDRDARKLVQAAQDVLTLLSQDGIYMDDMQNEPVDVGMWRQFAQGERGPSVAPLGTVQNETMLDAVLSRLRRDAIFRDAVHHFLRRFDQMLVTFEAQGTDTDMLAMADTRTARAFVLLGRAAGTFG